ncbi:hypothetical protein L1887_59062 [Cichorium endivia]|nr:hypothetical protein L1887_59062 [Cichorium endivia]
MGPSATNAIRIHHGGEAEPKRPAFGAAKKRMAGAAISGAIQLKASQILVVIGPPLPSSTSWPPAPVQVPTLHLFRAGWAPAERPGRANLSFSTEDHPERLLLCAVCRAETEMRFLLADNFSGRRLPTSPGRKPRVLPAGPSSHSCPNNHCMREKAGCGYDRYPAGAVAAKLRGSYGRPSCGPASYATLRVSLQYESMAKGVVLFARSQTAQLATS